MGDQDRFENPDLIWSPEQLQTRLGDEQLVVLDVRPTHQVMAGVIPGAVHLDIFGLGLTHTREEAWEEMVHLMRSLLGLRGIGPEKTVVVYEEDSGYCAARSFWFLDYMGLDDVHVLDGGMRAWREWGGPLTRELVPPRAVRFPVQLRQEIFITADELAAALGEPDLLPLDTRSDEEWYGENTRGTPRGGTIPGAVHIEWTQFLNQKGCFKSPRELAALLESHGVTRDKAIVPF